MGFFNKYPYTDCHELNLDWVIARVKECMEATGNMSAALELFLSQYDEKLRETLYADLLRLYEEGILSAIIADYVEKNSLVSTANVSIFAQAFPSTSGYYAQGMSAGTINGQDVMLTCFNGTSDCEVVIHNIVTGAEIARDNMTLGHCNSATFNPENEHFYVACGGGSNGLDRITEIDIDLNIIEEYELPVGTAPYGIAYNKENFYVLASGNRIIRYNVEMEEVETLNFLHNTDTIYQGLEVDDNFIYIPNGNGMTNYDKIVGSFVDVFTKSGAFVKKIYVNSVYEQEDIAIFKGETFMNFSTAGLSLICKSTLRESVDIFETSGEYFKMNARISGYVKEVYVDETYKDFFSDGSADYPLNSLYNAFLSEASQYVETLKINLMSDTTKNINIKYHVNKLNIDCHNHKVKGILLVNNDQVSVQNVEVYDRNDTYNSMIECRGCKYVYLHNVKLSTNVCDYGIKVNSSIVKVENVTFDVEANNYMLLEQENGFILLSGLTVNTADFTYNFFNPMSRLAGNVLPSVFENDTRDASGLCRSSMLTFVDDSETFDFTAINKANIYQFTASQVFSNGPTLASGERIDAAEYTFLGDKIYKIDVYVYSGSNIAKQYRAFKHETTLSAWTEV